SSSLPTSTTRAWSLTRPFALAGGHITGPGDALSRDVGGCHDLTHDGMGVHHRHRSVASHGPDLVRHGRLGGVAAGQLPGLGETSAVTDVGGGRTRARTGVGEVAVDVDLRRGDADQHLLGRDPLAVYELVGAGLAFAEDVDVAR